MRHSTSIIHNDVMGDASYIVEGKDALVVLEAPLFKDALAADSS